MAHEKGAPRTPGSGRKPGTPNKFTLNVKQVFEQAFEELGGKDSLVQWARREPTEFFKLIAKMLPKDVQVSGGDGEPIKIVIVTGVPGQVPDADQGS